jgi:ankyrin repeat protein
MLQPNQQNLHRCSSSHQASMVWCFISALMLALILSACSGERYTELMNASRDGDISAINRALDRGVEIDQRTTKGKTALMLAGSNGHDKAVALLIERGADISIKDVYGTTALIVSATSGRTDCVSLLLEHGANPLWKDSSGGSALDNATFFGHTATVKLLLDNIPVLPKDAGEELMLVSAGLGHTEIARFLLKKGVSANARGAKERTAIMAATAFEKAETAKLLIEHGADPLAADEDGVNALQLAKEKDNPEILNLLQPPAPAL